ncbi:muts domain III-domain-containing protein [Chytridium lagenaria]|nr:muts domain III-domain-containing protein [Chytridium lagenaria]
MECRFMLEDQRIVITRNSIRFKYESTRGHVYIDPTTERNLELVRNSTKTKSLDHLFGTIRKTITPMGGRLLKENIMSPINDEVTLNTRLNAVEELKENEPLDSRLRTKMKLITDIDKVISSLAFSSKKGPGKSAEVFINTILEHKTAYQIHSRDQGLSTGCQIGIVPNNTSSNAPINRYLK